MAKAGEGLFKKYIPKDIHEKVCRSDHWLLCLPLAAVFCVDDDLRHTLDAEETRNVLTVLWCVAVCDGELARAGVHEAREYRLDPFPSVTNRNKSLGTRSHSWDPRRCCTQVFSLFFWRWGDRGLS